MLLNDTRVARTTTPLCPPRLPWGLPRWSSPGGDPWSWLGIGLGSKDKSGKRSFWKGFGSKFSFSTMTTRWMMQCCLSPKVIYVCYFFSLDSSLDFDAAHAKVLATVLEVFAGPADKVVTPGFDVNNRPFFLEPGDLFAFCAALSTSHPTTCPPENSSGHTNSNISLEIHAALSQISSGGPDLHLDAKCSLLWRWLLKVYKNSRSEGFNRRRGKALFFISSN